MLYQAILISHFWSTIGTLYNAIWTAGPGLYVRNDRQIETPATDAGSIVLRPYPTSKAFPGYRPGDPMRAGGI